MIACQGDSDDARAKARESLAAAPADGSATPTTAGSETAQPSAVTAENQVPTGPTTTMVFEQSDFDFGSVKEGEKVKHTYKFKNTGKEPLIISTAKGKDKIPSIAVTKRAQTVRGILHKVIPFVLRLRTVVT